MSEHVERHLKVAVLRESNWSDPVATLRVIASEIEAGKYGEVGCCAVVVMGDRLEVFGCGPDAEGPSVGMVLCGGFMKIAGAIAAHGENGPEPGRRV